MEEALTCPIGFEAYDDKQSKPFILECGHTLCINSNFYKFFVTYFYYSKFCKKRFKMHSITQI